MKTFGAHILTTTLNNGKVVLAKIDKNGDLRPCTYVNYKQANKAADMVSIGYRIACHVWAHSPKYVVIDDTVKTYAACGYKGEARFAFNAFNDADAKSKITGFNIYHGITGGDAAYTYYEINPDDMPGMQIELHNEWM